MRVHMCDVQSGGQRRAFGKAGPPAPGARKRPSTKPTPQSPLSQVCSPTLTRRWLSGRASRAGCAPVRDRRMRWVDIDAAMSHQEEEKDWIRTSQAVSCTTEPFIARIARAVTNVASYVAIDATELDRDRVP